ncbi:ureF domain-containing protein [Hirsutella rhossiliensis]|uniref:UreF domain-containing protein n=1 Tax=Hirsutella rhossiliensis TaxID=111463 RepID=A0A9P8N281_9HYPO|nr:ureF domain-containing protein [Hirsutella rhossiliensis]KAH0965272.1 ureF domain-containing protein [Hirsutella rhossiliensis]
MATSERAAQTEVDELEARLASARARLRAVQASSSSPPVVAARQEQALTLPPAPSCAPPTTHFLLLLADSALPIGSFAFSSGLESYLAHHQQQRASSPTSFASFLPLSVSSLAAATLPFVLAAHRDPACLASLDDQLDAAVVCTVARRASVAQGRALLSIWERSFGPALAPAPAHAPVLRRFAALLREGSGRQSRDAADDVPPLVSAHLAPLFGAVCAVVGLGLRQAAYVFMLSHVKALISAAVRASMFGPFQAQKVLAGDQVQRMIDAVVSREWDTPVDEAGQSVPVMDLWVGRHELLYSRIFNS